MERGQLFVSFWHIGLESIPEGSFVHRGLAPKDARGLIDEARRAGALCCACRDDLFAPYHEDERRQHDELCRVLGEHHGIALSLEDFTIVDDVEGEDSCTIRPLAFADIDGSNRLIVVSCHYVMPSESEADSLRFEIEPESVTFHLFEATR